MRAAMYIRVSTEEQAKEGYSIDSQQSVCLRWINEKGHDLVETYIDDGYSSKNLKRPEMQRMMKDIERRKFDLLVFWRLNRVTRTVKDKEILFELFDQYNINLKSMTEEIDTTTASGRMVTNLLVSVAQGEREQTAENVYGTMLENHMTGKRQGAVNPYGYDLVDGELIVNEEQAKVVKKIFEMYAANLAGFREIAVTLNHDSEARKHREWNYSTVRYILMNPVYTGRLRWNYRKSSGRPTGKEVISFGKHEPLVQDDVFEKVNNEINGRKKGGKVATSDYAFAGVLRCNRCGRALSGFSAKKRNGRHRYYRCTSRTQYATCNLPIVLDEKVQEAFLRAIDYDSAQLQNMIDVKFTNQKDEQQKHIDLLKRELDTIQKRKKKWQLAYADEAISLDDFKERTREDKEREEQILQELHQMPKDETPRRSKEEILQYLSMVSVFWRKSPNEKTKKAFLRDIFKSITIDCEKERMHGSPGNFTEVKVIDWQLH